MKITVFPDVASKSMEAHELSWNEFVSRVKDPAVYSSKESMPLVKLATFDGSTTPTGSLRSGRALQEVWGIEVDYDRGKISPAEAAKVLAGLRGVLCTSSSHQLPGKGERWRGFFPLSLPITKEERAVWVAKLNGLFQESVFGSDSFSPAQCYYWGRTQSQAFEAIELIGGYVDQVLLEAEVRWDAPPRLNTRTRDEMNDPSKKDGIIGAFCWAFDAKRVLDELLPDEFEHDYNNRYNWVGHDKGGVFICDEPHHIGANHATWPFGENAAVNVWDVCRVFMFDPDFNEDASVPPAERPSHRKMVAFAESIPEVAERMRRLALTCESLPDPDIRPSYEVNKNGIAPTFDNVCLAVEHPVEIGCAIAFDEFYDEVMVSVEKGEWMQRQDVLYARMRRRLASIGFVGRVGTDDIRQAVTLIADDNRFNSSQEWLNSLQWDGHPRVESFLARFFHTPDDDYHRGVARYIWTAHAGRVQDPGIKADLMPVYVGKQGLRKSSAVRAMAPDRKTFLMLDMKTPEVERSRKIRGKLVVEFDELAGLKQASHEHIKSFITRQFEEYRKLYMECLSMYPRHCIFHGTTNTDEFLSDPTGNRRFLPVKVLKVIDVDGIVAEMEQLWAEGCVLYKKGGIDYSVELLAEPHLAEHLSVHPWVESISTWLDSIELGDEGINGNRSDLTVSTIAFECLKLDQRQLGHREKQAISGCMKALGYSNEKVWLDNKTRVVYRPYHPHRTSPS